MSLNKELWLPVIEGNLFSRWELLNTLGTDDTGYIVSPQGNNKKVYIPQAGASGGVTINPSTWPRPIQERVDDEHNYTLDHIFVDPIRLGNFDTAHLSYDKMSSILRDFAGDIGEAQLYKTFINWYTNNTVAASRVLTGGTAATSAATGSTQSVKKLILTDMIKVAETLDNMLIPDDGQRYAVLPAQMFYHLLESIVTGTHNITIIEKDGMQMLNQPIYGLNIVKFPKVINCATSTYAARAFGHAGATTDRQAGIAFHKSMVSVAKGDLNVMINEQDATMGGDILSAESWIGGKFRRKDQKGVVPIIQANE